MKFDRDFDRHNEEVEKVWESFNNFKPIRMPVILGINNRMILLDAKLNPQNYKFSEYFTDSLIMTEVSCECQYQTRHNYYADHEMGLPKDGWVVSVDRQNLHETGWLGAKVIHSDNNVPFGQPFLHDDNKASILDKPFPGIFENIEERSFRIYNEMLDLQKKGYEYKGRPIKRVNYGTLYSDGGVTLACMMRGADNFCADLIEDPIYAKELLDYITRASIYRIKELRKFFDLPELADGVSFADDSIALLSHQMYVEQIFPHHKNLVSSLVEDFDTSVNSIHLCGDVQRHFKFIKENLRVFSFDTGYPIDFHKLTTELKEDIIKIHGGVKVDDLLLLSPLEVAKKTKEIMDIVMPNTDRFIMREANNLSPKTPAENVYAMYQTVREHGWYK